MPFNHCQNEISKKRKKLDKFVENENSITEFKRLALKYYKEIRIQSFRSNKLSNTNDIHKLGIYCCFICLDNI